MSEILTYKCYRCGTLLDMWPDGQRGFCPKDGFWVDKPWEPRSEMPAETKGLEGR